MFLTKIIQLGFTSELPLSLAKTLAGPLAIQTFLVKHL
jgi:hypothetical protein